MAAKYCINDQTGMIRDNQKKKDKETLEDEKQELKSDFEFHLKEYTACYNRIGEREKQRESFEQKTAKTESYEEIKAQADSFGNTGYDETSYEKTKEIKKAMRMIVCPQYTAAYDDIHKKLGPRYEISRLCSSVLRKVEFDENWAPVSKEDMRNHEWNMKYLNHLHTYYLGPELEVVKQERLQNEDEMAKEKEEGWEGSVHQQVREKKEQSLEVLKDMIEEEYKKTYQGKPPFPPPEQLRKELFEPLEKGQPLYSESLEKLIADPGNTMPFMNKILNLEWPGKMLPGVDDMIKKHPEWDAFADVCRVASSFLLPMYMQTRYHMAFTTSPETKALVQRGQDFDRDLAEAYLANYEENYQKYQKLMNERKAG